MRRLSVFLQVVDVWLVALLWLGLIVLCWHRKRALAPWLRPATRPAVWAYALILIAGVLARVFWVPHTHYVFDDELMHIDIARNIQEHWRFAFSLSDCGPVEAAYRLPQWGPAFHVLLAFVFRLFGSSSAAVFALNATVGALTVPVAFAIGKVALGRDSAALVLAGLLCSYPLHLKFSGGGNLEPTSLLLAMLALFAVFVFARDPKPWAGAMALVAVMLAALTRIENGILAGYVVVILLRGARRLDRAARVRLITGCGLVMVLLCFQAVVAFRLYAYWRRQETSTHLLSAIDFLFGNPLNPVVLPLLALGGAFALWREKRPLVLALLSAWAAYTFTYTVVQRLDLTAGDFQRYNLGIAPVQLLLAVGAVDAVARWKRRAAGAVLVFVAVLWVAGLVRAMGPIQAPYHAAPMTEVEWLRRASASVPRGALICTATPVFVRSVTGLKATLPAMLPREEESRRDLFYYRAAPWKRPLDLWNRDPDEEVTSRFRLDTLAEFEIRPGAPSIGLYRMSARRDPGPAGVSDTDR